MSDDGQREAIRRAAELSTDRICAAFGIGAMNACKMREEIERTMAESLKFHEDCQSAFKDQRIATLEAMVKEALRVFDLHLNTPETRALRAQWKELTNQDLDRKSEA